MPDLLAHYAISYLLASRVARPSAALLLALAGLLPDIDALFRIHRWATHSPVLSSLSALVAVVLALYIGRGSPRYVALASALYILHIALDMFTAPTPVLWPLTAQAYMMVTWVNGTVSGCGISVAPSISIHSEPADFTQRPSVDGPIVSTMGMVAGVGVTVVLLIEWAVGRQGR